MSLFSRITTTISSSVDRAVSRVENHDAIVEAALRDTRHAGARARVRLERVRKDGRTLKNRVDELQRAEARWTERAKSLAADDESKALECLRRRKECESQLGHLTGSIEKHDELESQISSQVKKIEARISELSHQRNMMRSRQSVADAMRIVNNIEGNSYSEVENTLDRWEINLSETEILVGADMPHDSLESELIAEEDEAALRAELAAIVSTTAEDPK